MDYRFRSKDASDSDGKRPSVPVELDPGVPTLVQICDRDLYCVPASMVLKRAVRSKSRCPVAVIVAHDPVMLPVIDPVELAAGVEDERGLGVLGWDRPLAVVERQHVSCKNALALSIGLIPASRSYPGNNAVKSNG